MTLLERLRTDRPAAAAVRGRLTARLELAREHAVRSHEPQGWLGGVLIGAWSALLSLLAVSLPMLLVWAVSDTSAGWGEAVRLATQGWLLVHGVALIVPAGSLHLLPLGLTLLPVWLCWRAGRRLARSAPAVNRAVPTGALSSLAAPVLGLCGGYAAVLTVAALLAHGPGVRPVWWHAALAGVALPLVAGGASALRAVPALPGDRPSAAGSVVGWARLPGRVRRTVRPALAAAAALLALGTLLVLIALVVEHDRVLAVHVALDPGTLGTVVLSLGQLAILPNLALWAVAWLAGPGFAVGVGTAVTPAESTVGLLPLVPVLGALPPPGPLPAIWQGAVLVPLAVGAVLGWWCARCASGADAEAPAVVSAVLDAVVAATLAALLLAALALVSAGSGGPGHLADVGPSAWRVGLALLAELSAGAAVTAWITARRA